MDREQVRKEQGATLALDSARQRRDIPMHAGCFFCFLQVAVGGDEVLAHAQQDALGADGREMSFSARTCSKDGKEEF